MDRAPFDAAVAEALKASKAPPEGVPANPVYLPAPHEVATRVLHRVHDAARCRRTASGCTKACGTASR